MNPRIAGLALGLGLGLGLGLAGCSSTRSASDVARDVGYSFVGAGSMLAHAFDHECALRAYEMAGIDPQPDPTTGGHRILDPEKFRLHLDEAVALADRCEAGTEKARKVLKVAEDALGTWTAARAGDLGCAAGQFVGVVDGLAAIAKDGGFKMPSDVEKSLEFARTLIELAGAGGSCKL